MILKRIAAVAAIALAGLWAATEAATAEPERTVRMTGVPSYAPDQVIVKAGQTVRWVNVSEVEHTVTADPSLAPRRAFVHVPPAAEPFDSGPVAPGGSFEKTFNTPGTFIYFSQPHTEAEVIGRVTVEAADRAGRETPDETGRDNATFEAT